MGLRIISCFAELVNILSDTRFFPRDEHHGNVFTLFKNIQQFCYFLQIFQFN